MWKKLVLSLIVVITLCAITYGQQPQFTNYKDALTYARQNNRGMFLLFTATWCGPCQRLKHETLTPLANILQKRYVVYYVDVDQEGKVVEAFQNAKVAISSVPTYIISDNNGKIIGYNQGYKDIQSFVEWHNQIVGEPGIK